MTERWLAAASLMATVALLLTGSGGRVRSRLRFLLAGRHDSRHVRLSVDSVSGGLTGSLSHRASGDDAASRGHRASGGGPAGRDQWWLPFDRLLDAVPPRRAVLVAAAGGAVVGVAFSGPVAGIILAAYAGLAVRVALRRRAARRFQRRRRDHLDGLAALAADLRAGLPPSAVLPAPAGTHRSLDDPRSPARLVELTRAAVHLAEQTGAPLAELLERIETDGRAMDRGLAAAAAQAAGARATAGLLALLPLGGIALGYGIGADPVQILLHTPVGAACAVGAIALQLAGLAWADRLGGATRAAG